ncbi:TOMM precursor leader peptide-binding protein [Haladaptatus cibarius]|uniref:TOMM precursor leader peptide-binding protein n=1 Tax=Haladaptatus cibarius TaxID=453847 RepID=UPI000679B21F|nr:TOMM precursor leader peptide-binding protein [Haladaptatus cibarius]
MTNENQGATSKELEPETKELIEEFTDELAYPVFNPALVPTQVDANTIHIRSGPWSGPIVTIEDTEHDDTIMRLVDLIDGETHVKEILHTFPDDQTDEVAQALDNLQEKNIIYDRPEHEGDEVYPHLALQSRFRRTDRERLESKQVLIVTLGKMGSMVAEDLLSMGVAEVALYRPKSDPDDPDIAEEDGVTLVDDLDLRSAIEAADFVVYTADRRYAEIVADINEIAHETTTPWVSAHVLGFDGIVGPAVFPGETACYRCFEKRMLSNISNVEGYASYQNAVSKREDLAAVGLPSLSRAIAGYLALDLLHLISYGVGYTAGRIIKFDSMDLSVEINDVLKLPRCEVCGKTTGDDDARLVSLDDLVEADRIGSMGDD